MKREKRKLCRERNRDALEWGSFVGTVNVDGEGNNGQATPSTVNIDEFEPRPTSFTPSTMNLVDLRHCRLRLKIDLFS
ncbi:hypothetical protein ACOSQ2_027184 [Xanthoceras sorbifolium]